MQNKTLVKEHTGSLLRNTWGVLNYNTAFNKRSSSVKEEEQTYCSETGACYTHTFINRFGEVATTTIYYITTSLVCVSTSGRYILHYDLTLNA